MFFSLGFGIDEDVIKIYYYENVKLFYKNLVNVALERSRCVGQSKKYHLILEMAIAGPEDCFSFISFFDLHPIIGIGQIELGETSSPTQLI